MNRIVYILVLITSLILAFNHSNAQSFSDAPDVVKIKIDKSGKLEKLLKAVNAQSTKKLSIIANVDNKSYLNEKDILFLSTLSHLEELYLDIDIWPSKFIEKNGLITNKHLPNLKIFGIGKRREGLNVFNLDVVGLCLAPDLSIFPKGIGFVDIYLLDEPRYYHTRAGNGYYGNVESLEKWLSESGDYYETNRRLKNAPIHSVHVNDISWLNADILKDVNPAVIFVGNKKYLANYNSRLQAEDRNLLQYDGILTRALANINMDTIRIPDSQKTIPSYFFENVKANYVDLGNVVQICERAFAHSRIKELSIPASVRSIDGEFSEDAQIGLISMKGNYAPSIDGYPYFKDIQFIIPKGSIENYSLGEWKKVKVLEDGIKTDYVFTTEKPGILSSLLTDDVKRKIVTLKLRGLLDSEDIKLLKECLNLKKLDLGETYIYESTKELEKKQADADFLMGLFSTMGAVAQSEYEHDKLSTLDNLYVQAFAQIAEMEKGNKIMPNPNCISPDLLELHIEELVLPKVLVNVSWLSQPVSLKKIVLPPEIETITIAGSEIDVIKLPTTTQRIEFSRLDFGNGPHIIDMSGCDNPVIMMDESEEIKGLAKIKMPKRNNEKSFIRCKNVNVLDIYFQDKEILNDRIYLNGNIVNIHVPKGCLAGYGLLKSYNTNIIED